MDYQNRIGSKKGGGGLASSQELNIAQRQRVSELFGVEANPYFHKNHLGQFECKLCLTLHNTKESFLNHVQGRKHVMNLKKRETLQRRQDEEESKRLNKDSLEKTAVNANLIEPYNKIGLPSYEIQKLRDEDGNFGCFITVKYLRSEAASQPIFRLMSSFEVNSSKSETEHQNFQCDYDNQYLIVHSKPYSNISFKLPSNEILKDERFWSYWDSDIKEFYIHFFLKEKREN